MPGGLWLLHLCGNDWDQHVSRTLVSLSLIHILYICDGDTILFSNDGHGGMGKPYETFLPSMNRRVGYSRDMNVYGRVWSIYVMKEELNVLSIIRNNFALLLFLILVNLLLPALLMKGINLSLIHISASFPVSS